MFVFYLLFIILSLFLKIQLYTSFSMCILLAFIVCWQNGVHHDHAGWLGIKY